MSDYLPVATPFRLTRLAHERGAEVFRAFADNKRNLHVIVAREPSGPERSLRWHLSISHPDRDPTWAEQVEAIRELVPGSGAIEFVSYLPPENEHINAHEFCFHWWEGRSTVEERMLRAMWV